MTKSRKYLPTFSELIDRLSIAQLKEVFIPEHKTEYAEEISDIIHDINLIIQRSTRSIKAITKGIKDGNDLELTHGLNGIRNTAKNKIQEVVGGRKDYKIDCLAADFKDWEISWKK